VNASHVDYRKLVKDPTTGYEARLKKAELKSQQLTTTLEDTKSELSIEQAARRSALGALQTQIEQRESELAAQEAELTKLLAAHTALVATEQQTQQDLNARTKDNETLRKQIVDAREDRDQTFGRLTKAVDEKARLEGMYQSLNERVQQLASDYTGAKEKLDILGLKPNSLVQGAPAANGEVTAVSTSGLVEVSLGQDSGMREGQTLEVTRSGQYLGKLQITRVEAGASVAKILTGFQTGYIRKGDRVDTKLY
jgi:chromosome segregation ATPase